MQNNLQNCFGKVDDSGIFLLIFYSNDKSEILIINIH